jgi:SAM-dependent methyltransferase
MKLSEIVAYRNHLDENTPLNGALIAHNQLSPILQTVKSNDIQLTHLVDRLDQDYKNILTDIDHFERTLESIKEEVFYLIQQMEPAYFTESYRLYSQEMIYDSAEYILNRRIEITTEVFNYIAARIQTHGNWQHAGMIIHPGHEEWITYLVGHDPLYLVAPIAELLDPAVLRFNDQYQRRLRTYTVTESIDNPILENLPNNQFGFCLVYNFFNYKPQEIINQYLTEIYHKLKPGGVLAFTFNDCDQPGGVSLAERSFMCYTPGRTILNHAQKIGFQVRQQYKMNQNSTWIELQRPGKLTSLRGGQSLAKVVDKGLESMYTAEEIQKFRQQAIDLNIVPPSKIDQVPLAQLIHEIKQRIKQ